jgi:hypothetical protein
MRRYLRAAGIGELLGLFFWFLLCFMFGTGGYNSDTEWLWSARLPVKLFDSLKLYESTALEEKAVCSYFNSTLSNTACRSWSASPQSPCWDYGQSSGDASRNREPLHEKRR